MINSMVKTVLKNITISDILEAINKRYGNAPALRIRKEDGSLKETSFVKLGRRVITVSSALIKLGIEKGDRVAILSENRPEWAMAFFGILSSAAVTVPIDTKLTEGEIRFILKASGSKCVFVSEKYLPLIDNLRTQLPNLKHVIVFERVLRKDVIILKRLIHHSGKERNRPIYPEDTAFIVYTSGTTGIAKGVEITCKNLLFQVLSFSEVLDCRKGDELLSILPLNHMLEITGGLIAPLYVGACVTYSESLKPNTFTALMKETHTTVMISVPLVLKMIHEGIMKKVRQLSPVRRKLFETFLPLSKFLLKFNIRIGRILFKSVHVEFGGRMRGFISGGAPLERDVETGLNALGFRILQGYGLTETAPVISVNTFKETRFGSVGKPLPGVEVKILKKKPSDTEGEIITKGPHVMKGYFRDPTKAAEVIKDGWFYTGDLGRFDKEGFLYITGRIKNMIVLGAGKKVFPEEVEMVIGRSPYIKEICVLARIALRGIRKGYEEVYAAIVPDMELLGAEAAGDRKKIERKISSEITLLSTKLAAYKRIAGFALLFDELPKTVTKKIKRKAVSELIDTSV